MVQFMIQICMSSLHGSLDKKIVRATWNFKMVAIFQDGRHVSVAVKLYGGLFGDTSMKIGMSNPFLSSNP